MGGGGLVLKTMFKQIAVVKISNYVPLLGGVSGAHSGKTQQYNKIKIYISALKIVVNLSFKEEKNTVENFAC